MNKIDDDIANQENSKNLDKMNNKIINRILFSVDRRVYSDYSLDMTIKPSHYNDSENDENDGNGENIVLYKIKTVDNTNYYENICSRSWNCSIIKIYYGFFNSLHREDHRYRLIYTINDIGYTHHNIYDNLYHPTNYGISYNLSNRGFGSDITLFFDTL
jgi:hypothetical protein